MRACRAEPIGAGGLSTSAADGISKTAQKTSAGTLVDLPDSIPGALAILTLTGKRSGAFMVLGEKLTRAQARTVAQKIIDRL